MGQDARFALRFLRRSPGFTVAAVLTLALGIGATTAIFTLVDAVLLRPLDIGAPDRVLAVQAPQDQSTTFLYARYISIRDTIGSSMTLAIEYPNDVIIDTPGGRIRRRGAFVSPNYFGVLQRPPRLGRPFVAADDAAGAEPVVILSDTFWRTVLNGDVQAIGSPLRVSGVPMTIVGIAPPRVRGTNVQSPTDIFLPAHAIMRTHTLAGNPGNYFFQDGSPGWSPGAYWRLFGRLAPGVSAESAAAKAVCADCGPENRKLQLVPIHTAAVASRVRGDVSRFSIVLSVAVLLVLAIGCANLAGLVMARTEARRRDIAVRLAMGISRGRLTRQLLWECLLLAAAGAVAGVVLGRWLLAGLASFELPGFIPLGKIEYPLDARTLAFAIGASAISAIAFGLAPARAAARADIVTSLRPAGHRRTGRSRHVLIALQVGLTVVLVFGAGLFIRSLRTALGVDIGLDASRVVIADTDVRAARFDPARQMAYFDIAASRLQSLPRIASVSYGDGPFFLSGSSTPWLHVDGVELRLPANVAEFRGGPGYFRALGIPLIIGRDFASTDDAHAPPVVVVNAAFARRFWPKGESPLGHRVSVPPAIANATIIGVAEDGKYSRLEESGRLAVFMAWKQTVSMAGQTGLIVRTAGDAAPALPAIRDAARNFDPEVPVNSVVTLRERVSRGLQPQRLGFWLLGGFGVIAVLLGVIGIHGLVAFLVAQRTHEIGVRMALGAERVDIMRLMVQGVLLAVLAGTVGGLLAAWWLSAAVTRLLFGVGPHDPAAFAGTVGLLVVAAIAGVLIPARRAASVDPMIALRAE
jgi:predicted permease